MRIFIAVTVPDEIKRYLLDIQKELDGNAKLRFTTNFHITLKFLGDVDNNQIEKIIDSLQTVVFESFKVILSGTGVFPTEHNIKVIWVGLNPADKIVELQKKIDESLQNLFGREKGFSPHLTLARVKFINKRNELLESIKSMKVEEKVFDISEFKLINSTLTPQGPEYEDLGVFKAKDL